MPFVIAFFLGAVVGSFLNVCVFRIPRKESIVLPASHCLSCLHPIAWYDNIPVLSFFVLKGRCRTCGAKISWQYPLIEIVSAFCFVLFYGVFDFSAQGMLYLALTLALLAQGMIDWKHQIIPDGITLPGIVIGLLASALVPQLHGQEAWTWGLFYSFVGAVFGGGVLYLTGVLAEWILKKEAMGGGDVKLLAMIGSFLGWRGVLWTVFVASLSGSIIGLYFRLRKGEEKIPFGPYLAFAAFLYMFFGQGFFQWYWHLIGQA